jgi:hypothetical protein
MKYKVHQFDIDMRKDKDKLEQFLNGLDGEVVSVFPNIKPTLQGMGATAKVNFLYTVEKMK